MLPLAIVITWPETPIAILITLVVAIAGRWLLLRAIKRGSDLAVSRANQRRADQGTGDVALYAVRHVARAATMGSLLRSVTNAAISVLAVLTIMAILNIPLTPILASAGVGGVALGFGAQSLVKDYLSGASPGCETAAVRSGTSATARSSGSATSPRAGPPRRSTFRSTRARIRSGSSR